MSNTNMNKNVSIQTEIPLPEWFNKALVCFNKNTLFISTLEHNEMVINKNPVETICVKDSKNVNKGITFTLLVEDNYYTAEEEDIVFYISDTNTGLMKLNCCAVISSDDYVDEN